MHNTKNNRFALRQRKRQAPSTIHHMIMWYGHGTMLCWAKGWAKRGRGQATGGSVWRGEAQPRDGGHLVGVVPQVVGPAQLWWWWRRRDSIRPSRLRRARPKNAADFCFCLKHWCLQCGNFLGNSGWQSFLFQVQLLEWHFFFVLFYAHSIPEKN